MSEENRNVANLYFSENNINGKVLVVNPFMGGSAKNITDEQYINILKKVKQETPNLNIIITCHISDEERAEKLRLALAQENIFVFANGASILNTTAIIERANVYFGGSTGPTHIAGALRKKIVAIYPNKKTQSPTRWGIYGNNDVTYIIPDENRPKENYKNLYFDDFNSEYEDKVVNALVEALKWIS